MAVFVLLHGAWGGSTIWRRVRDELERERHRVYTPGLTGLGDRAHLVTPQTGLHTHVQDLTAFFDHEDLTDVILAGFSYGGMVITGALDSIAHRLRHLVYVDAFIPQNGDTVLSMTGRTLPPSDGLYQPWLLPPVPREFDDPEFGAWVSARRSPQPVRSFTEAVSLSKPLEHFGLPLSCVKATQPPRDTLDAAAQAFWAGADRASSQPDWWRYQEIDSDHMLMCNRPSELVDFLLDLP